MRSKFKILPEHQEVILFWYFNEDGSIMIISGYAGCGKSTLARSIPELLDIEGEVAFLAPTGKAANVLSGGAKTIHSYLYYTSVDPVTKELHFEKKDPDDFEESLLIVDEISMVNEELLADLIATGIRIIGLGDPAQLPPVQGTNKILLEPDIFLTEVFRNDGGLLDLATDIRQGNKMRWKDYNNVNVRWRSIQNDLALIDDKSIVICKFNKTRNAFNKYYRTKMKGFAGLLGIGEKLIITKNNKTSGLMNGSIVILEEIILMAEEKMQALIKVRTTDGYTQNIIISLFVLMGLELKLDNDRKVHYIDYAYAITCHKAQGSEYDNVFVINEGSGIGDHTSWLYTAVTRARKQLWIYI